MFTAPVPTPGVDLDDTNRQVNMWQNTTKTRRKKPAKPNKHFPSFAFQNGQWCKKIKGVLRSFGPVADPDAALNRYLDEKNDWYAGRIPEKNQSSLSVADLGGKSSWQRRNRNFRWPNSQSPHPPLLHTRPLRKPPRIRRPHEQSVVECVSSPACACSNVWNLGRFPLFGSVVQSRPEVVLWMVSFWGISGVSGSRLPHWSVAT